MATTRKATVDTFGNVLEDLVTEYTEDVIKNIRAEIRQLGKDAKTDVKEKANAVAQNRFHSWSEYIAGWTTSYSRAGNLANVKVWNKPKYQLVHLLEDGHAIVVHGKNIGRNTQAFPHVREVQQKYDTEAVRRIKGAINK